MSELLIEKDKKTEWIKKFGGEEGLAFLGTIVKELASESELIVKNEDGTPTESVTPEAVEATEPVVETAIEKSAEVSAVVPQVSIENILKQYTTDVVQPLYDSIYNLQEYVRALEVKNVELGITLKTVLEQVSGVSNYVKSFAVVETTPSASYRSLINAPTLSPVLGSPVMKDDPILKEKPVENKNVVVKDSSPFAGFMQGV